MIEIRHNLTKPMYVGLIESISPHWDPKGWVSVKTVSQIREFCRDEGALGRMLLLSTFFPVEQERVGKWEPFFSMAEKVESLLHIWRLCHRSGSACHFFPHGRKSWDFITRQDWNCRSSLGFWTLTARRWMEGVGSPRWKELTLESVDKSWQKHICIEKSARQIYCQPLLLYF